MGPRAEVRRARLLRRLGLGAACRKKTVVECSAHSCVCFTCALHLQQLLVCHCREAVAAIAWLTPPMAAYLHLPVRSWQDISVSTWPRRRLLRLGAPQPPPATLLRGVSGRAVAGEVRRPSSPSSHVALYCRPTISALSYLALLSYRELCLHPAMAAAGHPGPKRQRQDLPPQRAGRPAEQRGALGCARGAGGGRAPRGDLPWRGTCLGRGGGPRAAAGPAVPQPDREGVCGGKRRAEVHLEGGAAGEAVP